MPAPEILNLIALLGIFAFLLEAIKNAVFLPCAYLAIIMTKPGIYYPVLAEIRFELIVAIMALAMILGARGKNKLLSLKRSKILWAMVVFLLVIAMSMIQAFDIAISLDRIYIEIMPNLILVCLVLVFCKERNDIKVFLWTFGIITALLGYEPIYRYLHGDLVETFGDFDYAVAKAGLVRGHTSLAHYLLQGMPILWYLALTSKNIVKKVIGISLFVVCFYGVLISGSRGGLVGLVVMCILISVFSKRTVLMMASSGVILIALFSAMGGEYMERMRSILALGGSDSSAGNRLEGLVSGVEMLIRRPILGVGPGCYPVARKAWFNWGLWAHNHYGELAGELGILGIITWGLFAWAYIKSNWMMRKSTTVDPWIKDIATAILVTTGVRLSLGMFDHSVYKFIWYIMASLTIVLEGLNRRKIERIG
jgi:O-antigen ligase